MDKKFSSKTISKNEICERIKRDVNTAARYRKEDNMKQALTFAKMAYVNFRALCYLGIGSDDDFSTCFDYYAKRTDIYKITDLNNMISHMLKYNDEFI